MKNVLKLAALALALPVAAQAELSPMSNNDLQNINGQGVLISKLPLYASQLGQAAGAVVAANVALALTSADVVTEARADVLDSAANFNNGVASRLEATGGPILTYKAGYFRLLADSEQYRATRWRGVIGTPAP
ncbi:MAG TPA: hypothetical protein VNK45_06495 [Candidatus Acidoferrales bacterium]|nr:hypothetical protein [Candidatus Acidoferrales bacterium]